MQDSLNMKNSEEVIEVLKYFNEMFPFLDKSDIDVILGHATFMTFKKNQHIIKAGEFDYSIYFVFDGLIRAYYYSEQGNELTPFFWNEHLITASWETIYNQKPSSLNFEAIEDTFVGIIDFNKLKKAINENDQLQKAYITMMESILTNSLVHTQSFIHEKPESRYERFKMDFPNLLNRISQKHMASYLGITPISFSRMKKRMGE